MSTTTTQPNGRADQSRPVTRSTRRRRGAVAVFGIAVSAALLTASCSSSGSTAAAGATGPKLAGAPIKVMTIGNWTQPSAGTQYPQYPAGAQARAQAVNNAGGIHNRPIQVIVCSDENDPNTALRCARNAVSDKVAAVVGLQTPNDNVILPVLAKAGIPAIGVYPFNPIAFTSKVSFPDVAGVYAIIGGMPHALAAAGAKRVSLIYPGGAAGANLFLQQWGPGVKAANLHSTGEVAVPANAHDLSAVVAAATKNGTDGVAGVSLDAEASLVQAMRQQAPNAKFATTTFNLSDDVIKALGPIADGVLAAETTVPTTADTAGVTRYKSDLAAFKKSLPVSSVGLHEWLAMWTFERVVRPLTTIDASTVLAAMGKINNLDMGGIIPPYSTTKPATNDPSLPRMFNPTAVIDVVKNGQWTLLNSGAGAFINVFTGQSAS